ncbi:MAG: GreA/GreB family elongation factor [Gaiella sp.]|nr:GreA/GreB family elongation factor [Gaiella sp.]
MSAVGTEYDVEDGQLITADGFERLRHELEELRDVRRRELAERLREARADGDVADNPALLDLLDEHAQLERRIAVLESQIASARVVTPARDGAAGLGTFVRVRDTATGEVAQYELVGAVEADVGNGRVSLGAPVGRALVGRRKGDVVEVQTPRGTIVLEVLAVSAGSRQPARRAA